MLQIQTFTFLPQAFAENTYVIADEDGNCAIVDPGCYMASEQTALSEFISEKGWKVEKILLTHAHIDHIAGLKYVHDTYQVPIYAHLEDKFNIERASNYAGLFGLAMADPPMPDHWIDEGAVVEVGKEKFDVLFTPGHSPGHISFYHAESKQLFSGDVLFRDSYGRTDLPGGSLQVLRETIVNKIFLLPEETVVYAGHMGTTTVGREKRTNPILG